MVHMPAYPFKGLEFHGRNPQNWILYVLNTFPQRVGALDPLNPAHHQHIGVGLCILFFEVIYVYFIHCVMISSRKSQFRGLSHEFIDMIYKFINCTCDVCVVQQIVSPLHTTGS